MPNEPLKIIRGVIFNNGSVACASYGVSSSMDGAGTITLTFTRNPFSTFASVVATAYNATGTTSAILSANSTNATPQTRKIKCFNGTTQVISGISFIAIG